MNDNRTEINKLGEFKLIKQITKPFSSIHKNTAIGIGDDSAVIDVGEKYLLFSTDMLLEGIHFDLTYTPLQHLGYKSVSVNVSDIAAMNGVPKQITVSVGLSNRFSVEAAETLYQGIYQACKDYKIDLVGGDTTSSQSGLVISISIIGEVEKDKMSLRSKAQKNDIVCVTGDLGSAFGGLRVLQREKHVFSSQPNMQPELKSYKNAIQKQLKPTARMDIIHELKELNVVPKAMIDISDGLASELFHLNEQSNVGFRIFGNKLPVTQLTFDLAQEFKSEVSAWAMNGGEDYELLFTISPNDYDKLKSHDDIHFIGYVTENVKDMYLVNEKDQLIPLQAQGWNHFGRNKK